MTTETPWTSLQGQLIRRPESLTELWYQIGSITFDGGYRTQWVFRGVRDHRWRVQSSLVRRLITELGHLPTEQELVEAEDRLMGIARDWGIGLETSGLADNLHLLALMQHHGLPTRLLDVTANPLTALFFSSEVQTNATGEVLDDTDGVFVAFSVSGLKSYDTLQNGSTWSHKMDPVGATWNQALSKSTTEKAPFLVTPKLRDVRMTAQEGLFISSAAPGPSDMDEGPLDCILGLGSNLPGLTSTLSSAGGPGTLIGDVILGFGVRVLIVPAELKPALRLVLEGTFNRSPRSMYPDLMGFRDALDSKTTQMKSAPQPVATTLPPHLIKQDDPTSEEDDFSPWAQGNPSNDKDDE